MGASKERGGLGFRDFDNFNTTIMAKQIWRILNQPSSLMARIMKEKYFKTAELLKAKLGHCPSYIWRSLKSTMGLVKKGIKWKVRDVKKISL